MILAIAALAAAGCSKVEPQTSTPDVKIGYQVANYLTQTKAAGSFLDEVALFDVDADDALFKSVAFINADDGNGGVAAPAKYYGGTANNIETITFDDTENEWAPSHTYYWPKSPNSNLDFFSWYDLTETSSTNKADVNFASNTYTLAWTADRTISLKDNVMYADPVWNKKQNNKPAQYGYDSVSEGVPTLFRHALAQVRFQFKQKTMRKLDKNGTDSTFWVVTVKNLAIPASTLKKEGKLTLTCAKNATSWTLPTDQIWGAPTDQTYWASSDIFLANAAGTTGIELTKDAVTFSKTDQMPNQYITVLPQAIANTFLLNFDIKIDTYFGATLSAAKTAGVKSSETLHVKDFATGGAIVHNSGIQLNLMTTIGSNWQMNKKYTYIFEIDPETSTILYDPAVEDWASDLSQTQTIPQPTA